MYTLILPRLHEEWTFLYFFFLLYTSANHAVVKWPAADSLFHIRVQSPRWKIGILTRLLDFCNLMYIYIHQITYCVFVHMLMKEYKIFNYILKYTKSDNKVTRLVPKKVLFYGFINYNVVTFKVHPLCLHTPFLVVLPLFVAFLEHILWDVV
jgi:hypothetical protein